MLWLYIAITAVVSYFLGCMNGAIFISKFFYRKDIRKYGSGNAGLTNFYRTFGGRSTLIVLAIDLFKAAAAVVLGGFLLGKLGYAGEGKMIGMLFAILGHMFPAMFHFKGGKGILSAAGAILFLDWRALVILLSIFIVITAVTRFVSLGSIIGISGFPFCVWFFCGNNVIMTVMAAFCTLLIIFMHRENIGRLVRHEESKFSFKKNG